ncbi:MAG: aldehyde dehydrogenase family protein [Bacillota bacterium]
MGLGTIDLERLVKRAIQELSASKNYAGGSGVFETVDEAVEAARIAQKELVKLSLSQRNGLIRAMREAAKENVELIAKMAWEETGLGRYEDKVLKNILAIEKTPGIEDLQAQVHTGDGGLTLTELSPYGVIGAITPMTNPTATIICNSIGMIAAGNSVVFSPHPNAKNCSRTLIEILNRAIVQAGGPNNLLTATATPSIQSANEMMQHPTVSMIVATGGPGVVKTALSTGKKAIGAGAGNPPALVDTTANLEKAAADIINGCGFDNNVLCIAEKEVIVVESVADLLIHYMKQLPVYHLTDKALLDQLVSIMVNENGAPNKKFVGKNANVLLKEIGIEADSSLRVIIVETKKDHPFVQEEMLMPILPIVRVKDVDEGIDLAVELEHGNRHTAIMHSRDVDNLTKCAKAIQTTIFVKNAPSYAGLGFGGEGHTTMTVAGPTGEGITSAKSFARTRRCVLGGGFSIK